MVRAFLVLAIATCAVQAQASQISGQGKAINSTIIEISTQRIMLFGIDSVMRKQICDVGRQALAVLDGGGGRSAEFARRKGLSTCDVVGEPDVYGRVLGRCPVNGQNVNEQLVEPRLRGGSAERHDGLRRRRGGCQGKEGRPVAGPICPAERLPQSVWRRVDRP